MRNFFILYSKRINNLSIIILLISVIILSNFFSIQVLNKNIIKPIVQNKGYKTIEEYGKRGSIYDANNKELAVSSKKFNFWVNTNKPFEKEKIIKLFSTYFKKSHEHYENILSKKSNYVRVEKNIPNLEAKPILLELKNIKGLHKEEIEQRFYPYDFLAAQTIGYVNLKNYGINGIEGFYNTILSGDTVKTKVSKGAKGKYYKESNNEDLSINGYNIHLTIDIELQKILGDELHKMLTKTKAKSANGIIVNPMNGDILAMSSLPSFNPNKYYDFEIENYKNKVISDSYEPGSTFKIVALSGILDLNIHNDEDKFYCENGETTLINRKKLRDHEPHEFLNISEIFTYSSNIGMSKIVSDLDQKDFYKYCKLFGFGTKSGIPLKDEASGNIRELNHWSKTSKTYLSIGQELSVTNLQLAMAYATIANGGYLLKPNLIKMISTGENESIYTKDVYPIRKVIKKENSDKLLNYLENVVNHGTAENLNLSGYNIGGKTGTAQKFIENSYSKNEFISSFASVFPIESPKYVLLVSIDSPKYGYHWANQSAVPVTKEIIKRIIIWDNDMHISNNNAPIVAENNINENNEKNHYYKKEDISIVPNFKGKPLREALSIANSRGLKLLPSGISGRIVWQSIKPGSTFEDNEVCKVRVKI